MRQVVTYLSNSPKNYIKTTTTPLSGTTMEVNKIIQRASEHSQSEADSQVSLGLKQYIRTHEAVIHLKCMCKCNAMRPSHTCSNQSLSNCFSSLLESRWKAAASSAEYS